MNTLDPNTVKPVPQEKGLIPEGVKLALNLILLLAVAYLFYDNSRIKKAQQARLDKIADQVQLIESAQKVGESSITYQLSNLKTELAGTQEAVGTTKAEIKKIARQIQAEGQRNKQELSQTKLIENFTRVPIFYATDRRRDLSTTPASFYIGSRNESADEMPLEYGSCVVSIPVSHRTGEMESPKWWKMEFRSDPEKHVTLLSVVPKSSDSFFANLKIAVDRSSDRDAFIFIHGYNTTFQDASRRTAELAYDLRFKGAPILYSWPSQGKTTEYIADEAAVEWSTDHLRWLLTIIRQKTGATKIHLIAHSMGSRALIRALEAMPSEQTPIFRSIVLAAPDIDAGLFRQLAAKFASKANRVTLYASSQDEALIASKEVHGYPRAGETSKGVLILPRVDTIDASAVKTDFLGHSYFDSIVPDMFVLFQFLAVPDQRPKLMPRAIGKARYWMIQP